MHYGTAAGTATSPMTFTPTVLSSAAPHVGSLTFSPNPATAQVRVAGLPTGSSVHLVDMLGRLARETTVSAVGEVSVLGPGFYLLRATDRNGRQYAARVTIE